MDQPAPQIVLSGVRATGRTHLGNYLGALRKFARLSRDPAYECYFFVADLHTLTTFKEAADIRAHAPDIITDMLAAGVDPERAILYIQSRAPEVCELAWYLECIAPFGDTLRIPTFKDKAEKHSDDVNAGLFNYPILMAADILGPRAHVVPVGDDQVPHLEFTRELARRFNRRYGEYFPIPVGQAGERVPALAAADEKGDFGKMGKSEAPSQTLFLSAPWEENWEKLRTAPTDPARARRTDPGTPEKCAIFQLHKFVSTDSQVQDVIQGCTTAGISCLDCKTTLGGNLRPMLDEFAERRREIVARPGYVEEVVTEGSRKARAIFQETVREVGDRMGVFR